MPRTAWDLFNAMLRESESKLYFIKRHYKKIISLIIIAISLCILNSYVIFPSYDQRTIYFYSTDIYLNPETSLVCTKIRDNYRGISDEEICSQIYFILENKGKTKEKIYLSIEVFELLVKPGETKVKKEEKSNEILKNSKLYYSISIREEYCIEIEEENGKMYFNISNIPNGTPCYIESTLKRDFLPIGKLSFENRIGELNLERQITFLSDKIITDPSYALNNPKEFEPIECVKENTYITANFPYKTNVVKLDVCRDDYIDKEVYLYYIAYRSGGRTPGPYYLVTLIPDRSWYGFLYAKISIFIAISIFLAPHIWKYLRRS